MKYATFTPEAFERAVDAPMSGRVFVNHEYPDVVLIVVSEPFVPEEGWSPVVNALDTATGMVFMRHCHNLLNKKQYVQV